MSRRSKLIRAAVPVFGVLILFAGPAFPGENSFIRFFQDHISAVDGDRCPMNPSCSQYAARAMKKHGPVMGWIMACDRLVRCGRDEAWVSPHVRIKGRDYIQDPVAANDFWWFGEKIDKGVKSVGF